MAGRRKTSKFKNRLLGKKALDIKEMRLSGVEVEQGPGGTDIIAVLKGERKVIITVEVFPPGRSRLNYRCKVVIGNTGYDVGHYDFDELWAEARRVAAGGIPETPDGVDST